MFEVGKKVICIKNHSQGAVKRGQVFRLLGIKENPCCGYISLDIGIRPIEEGYLICGICRDTHDDSLSGKTTEELLQELEECSHLQLQNI